MEKNRMLNSRRLLLQAIFNAQQATFNMALEDELTNGLEFIHQELVIFKQMQDAGEEEAMTFAKKKEIVESMEGIIKIPFEEEFYNRHVNNLYWRGCYYNQLMDIVEDLVSYLDIRCDDAMIE